MPPLTSGDTRGGDGELVKIEEDDKEGTGLQG
jgi:hypothetical protein